MGSFCERWRIQPLELPRPSRYCASCATARAFVCSERFRVNANKKSLDVWLNYRCASCDNVWKFPLFERRAVSELGGALLDAFARHDRAAVWKYAFDVARLRPHVIEIDTDVRVEVDRTALACDCASAENVCIRFDVPFPCDIRLDRLLAGELGISRSALERSATPEQRAALRKRVRDGQVYMLSKNDLTADKQNGGTNVL
ncbi:MAG TPA: DUF1062 domain-containing protein [Steroidobacteraceae bacterium]|nr:DUF1062 domain-containing protein [Steroidobacteraceae bacterium]